MPRHRFAGITGASQDQDSGHGFSLSFHFLLTDWLGEASHGSLKKKAVKWS
jgi:hypothetical protein